MDMCVLVLVRGSEIRRGCIHSEQTQACMNLELRSCLIKSFLWWRILEDDGHVFILLSTQSFLLCLAQNSSLMNIEKVKVEFVVVSSTRFYLQTALQCAVYRSGE